MIGKIIKDLRIKNNITQESLAQQLNVTRQVISKWENDKSTPDLYTLNKLTTIFQVNIDDFFNENGELQIELTGAELLPSLRFIGKRYSGNESLHIKWKLWLTNNWFNYLKDLNTPFEWRYIGAKRIVNGALEYWIGMFFYQNTNVPHGFEYFDTKDTKLANFLLYGYDRIVTSFETHNLCLDKLVENNMVRSEDNWCFEYYDFDSSFITEKNLTIEYKISIL